VNPRPDLEPHAVTPAQAAHRQIACEDQPQAAIKLAHPVLQNPPVQLWRKAEQRIAFVLSFSSSEM
jgi:hypothetical protein